MSDCDARRFGGVKSFPGMLGDIWKMCREFVRVKLAVVGIEFN